MCVFKKGNKEDGIRLPYVLVILPIKSNNHVSCVCKEFFNYFLLILG